MNERIEKLYQQAHEPQPPARGTGTLTKDILWEQPKKFNPEKFAELLLQDAFTIIKEAMVDEDMLAVDEIIADRLDDAAFDVCDQLGLIGPIYED